MSWRRHPGPGPGGRGSLRDRTVPIRGDPLHPVDPDQQCRPRQQRVQRGRQPQGRHDCGDRAFGRALDAPRQLAPQRPHRRPVSVLQGVRQPARLEHQQRSAMGCAARADHAVRRRQLRQYPRPPGLRDRLAVPPSRRCDHGGVDAATLGQVVVRGELPPVQCRVRRNGIVSGCGAGRGAEPPGRNRPRPVPLRADAADHAGGRHRRRARPIRADQPP